jgi:hypothetical protein
VRERKLLTNVSGLCAEQRGAFLACVVIWVIMYLICRCIGSASSLNPCGSD